MKTYNNFDEMAADNMSAPVGMVSDMSVFSDSSMSCGAGQPQSAFVCNWYGDGVTPTHDAFSKVMISITSSNVTGKLTAGLGDYETDNLETWAWLKEEATDIPVEISVFVKGDDSAKIHETDGSFNTKTGKLSVGGSVVGTLVVNPIDAIMSVVRSGGSQLITTAEKVIWDYVNDNPEKFMEVPYDD